MHFWDKKRYDKRGDKIVPRGAFYHCIRNRSHKKEHPGRHLYVNSSTPPHTDIWDSNLPKNAITVNDQRWCIGEIHRNWKLTNICIPPTLPETTTKSA